MKLCKIQILRDQHEEGNKTKLPAIQTGHWKTKASPEIHLGWRGIWDEFSLTIVERGRSGLIRELTNCLTSESAKVDRKQLGNRRIENPIIRINPRGHVKNVY